MRKSNVCAGIVFFGMGWAAVAATWTGGGANDNWTTAANWGGTASAAGAELVFDGAVRTAPVNDFAAGTSFGGITFEEGAASFTLSGNGLLSAGTVWNESPHAQTFALPFTGRNGVTFKTETGDFIFSDAFALSADASEKRAYKQGPHALVFEGVSAFTNGQSRFVIQNGTLRFAPGSRFFWNCPTASYRFSLDAQPSAANTALGLIVDEDADVTLPNITVFSSGGSALTGSTFDMVVNGRLALPNTDTDFGDQAGKSISLTVGPSGRLTGAWLSLGTRTPMTTTINGGEMIVNMMSFGRLDSTGDRPGANTLVLNAGRMVVSNYFGTMSTSAPSVENALVLGDGTPGKATLETSPLTRAGANTGTVKILFDGAEIVTRGTRQGADFFGGTQLKEVGAGGFIIRANHAIDVFGPLEHAASLPEGVKDGGLIKRGTEVLTLREGATITGPIRVEEGRLSFHGAPPSTMSALYIAPGAMLNMGNLGSIGDVLTAPEMSIGSADGTAVTLMVNLGKQNGECISDVVRIPAGGFVGRVCFTLRTLGGVTPGGEAGDYAVIEYEDTYPQLSGFSVAELLPGLNATFVHDAANRRILLRITQQSSTTSSATWSKTTGGAYAEDANWNPAAPVSADGSAAIFGAAATEDATVTLDSVTQLTQLTFDNAGHSYTLAGAGLRLGYANGVMPGSRLNVNAGSHTIAAPFEVVSTTRVTRAAGTRLTVSGTYSSTRPTMFCGGGTTELTGEGRVTNGGLYAMNGVLRFRGANFELSDSSLDRLALNSQVEAVGCSADIEVLDGSCLKLSGLYLGSQSGAAGASRMTVDDATIVSSGEVTMGNKTGGTVAVDVRNGASVTSRGSMNFGVNGSTVMNVSNATFTANQIVFGGYGNTAPVSPTARAGTSQLHVWEGGVFTVTDNFDWICDTAGQPHTLVVHAGGRANLPPTLRADFSVGTATLQLDGGTLVCRANAGARGSASDYLHGTDVLAFGAAGGTIDTIGQDVTILQTATLAPGASASSFTKTGMGALMLGGLADGLALNVAQGMLTLTNGVANDFKLPSLTLGDATELMLDAGDSFTLSGALTLQGSALLRLPVLSAAGTYTLVRAASISGDISSLHVVCDQMPAGTICTLAVDGTTVKLTVGSAPAEAAHWTTDADGEWRVPTNWSTETAPAGADALAFIDANFTASRTITLPDGGAALGTLVVSAPQAPLLAGGPLAANLLQVGGAGATLACPLAFGADPLEVSLLGGATLSLAANVSAGALDVTGAGTLAVTATNAAATAVNAMTLLLGDAGRQMGAVALNGGTLASSGAENEVAGAVTLAGAAKIEARADSTLRLTGGVSGSVPLRKTGAGTLRLEQPFTGEARVDGGLVESATLPGEGLQLGLGTFHVTGAGTLASISGSADQLGASVFWNDADVAVEGPVAFAKSVLVKRGAGTLTFQGDTMTISPEFPGDQQSSQDGVITFGEHGATPSGGCQALVVADGTVVFDNPNATITLQNLAVGRWTSGVDGHETAAHAIFRNGSFNGYLGIGRGNGSTDSTTEPLVSSVRFEGGTHKLTGITMGHSSGRQNYWAAPLLEIAGGEVTVSSGNPFNIAERQGSHCTYRQTGGAASFSGGDVRVGNYHPGGTATFDLQGGTMTVANTFNLAESAASMGTLFLASGARLAVNMIKASSGTGVIHFNGGTLAMRTGPMERLDGIIDEGDAIFSVESERLTWSSRLRHAEGATGGLVKRGTGELKMGGAATLEVDDYVGPVKLEEGTITVSTARAPFPTSAALVTSAGTLFQLSLGDGSGTHRVEIGSADFSGSVGFRPGDSLVVSDSLTFRPDATVSLFAAASDEPLSTPGTYALIECAGAAPDVSGLTVANPVDGFSYAFAVENGTLSVTISAGPGANYDATWKTNGDGVWSESSNWTGGARPAASGVANFMSAISAPHVVTVDQDVTVGGLLFNNANAYTLAGTSAVTLGLNGGQPSVLASLQGTHRVETPVVLTAATESTGGGNLVLAGGVTGNAQISKTGLGRLTLSGDSDVAVDARAGALDVSNGNLAGNVVMAGARLECNTAEGEVSGTVRLAANAEIVTAKPLTITGPVTGDGALAVAAGTLRLAHANTRTAPTTLKGGRLELVDGASPGAGPFVIEAGTLASSGEGESVVPSAVELRANPTFDTAAPLLLADGMTTTDRRVFTKNGTNTLTLAGEWINPPAVAGRFLHNDGTLRLAENAVLELSVGPNEAPAESSLRLQFDTSGQANYSARAIELERGSRLSSGGWFIATPSGYDYATKGWMTYDIRVRGGLMESTGAAYGFIFGDQGGMRIHIDMQGGEIRSRPNVYSDIGTRTPVVWDVDGGAQVHLGYTAFGRGNGAGGGRLGGSVRLNVKDGLFDAGQYFSWQSTDDAAMTNIVTLGTGARATNAVFQTVPTCRPGTAGRAELVFNGGVLRATGAATDSVVTKGSVANYLNGVNTVRVGPGGAGFESSSDITVAQPLSVLPEGDGGVFKLGTGKVTLSGSLASITGRVDVLGGTLAGLFANTNDLGIADGAVFDLSKGTAADGWTFGAVAGNGTASNGTLTVATSLAPGDADGVIGVFKAQNLAFAKGTTIRVDREVESNDTFAVSGTLTMNGGGVIDFGHELGDVVEVPFSGVLGTYGTFAGSTGGWRATGLGYPATRVLSANLRADNGVVRFTVRDSGLVLIFR